MMRLFGLYYSITSLTYCCTAVKSYASWSGHEVHYGPPSVYKFILMDIDLIIFVLILIIVFLYKNHLMCSLHLCRNKITIAEE